MFSERCEKEAKRRGLCWTHEFFERYNTNSRFRKNRNKTKREYNRRLLRRYRNSIAEAIGGWECAICGVRDKDVLTFDHLNGGGETERNRMGGQLPTIRYYYHHLGEAKGKLQVLCANCNWKKNVMERYGREGERKELDEQKMRNNLIEALGGWKCASCGQKDKDVLTIDHPRGGGSRERIERNGYASMIHYYASHTVEARERLRIMCRSCNWKEHVRRSNLGSPL